MRTCCQTIRACKFTCEQRVHLLRQFCTVLLSRRTGPLSKVTRMAVDNPSVAFLNGPAEHRRPTFANMLTFGTQGLIADERGTREICQATPAWRGPPISYEIRGNGPWTRFFSRKWGNQLQSHGWLSDYYEKRKPLFNDLNTLPSLRPADVSVPVHRRKARS